MLAAAGIVIFSGLKAYAQPQVYIDTSYHNVTVDLSVIDDSGYGRTEAAALPAPAAGGKLLLMPGPRAPISRLHVPAPIRKFSPAPMAAKKPPKKPKAVKMAAPPKVPEAPVVAVVQAPSTPPPPPQTKPLKKKESRPTPLKEASQTPSSPPAKPKIAEPAKPQVAETAPPPPPAPAPVKEAKSPAPAASKPEKQTGGEQQASLPSPGAPLKEGLAYRVVFASGASKLPTKQKEDLNNLAKKIKNDDSLRLQLHAYAGDASLSSSKARRLSLSRALSVRSYLIESGVRSTRIDVRALGNKTKKKPLDRVDINVVKR